MRLVVCVLNIHAELAWLASSYTCSETLQSEAGSWWSGWSTA